MNNNVIQKGSECRQRVDLVRENVFTEIPMGHLGKETLAVRKRLSKIKQEECIEQYKKSI